MPCQSDSLRECSGEAVVFQFRLHCGEQLRVRGPNGFDHEPGAPLQVILRLR